MYTSYIYIILVNHVQLCYKVTWKVTYDKCNRIGINEIVISNFSATIGQLLIIINSYDYKNNNMYVNYNRIMIIYIFLLYYIISIF
jgi:hypothetical protein